MVNEKIGAAALIFALFAISLGLTTASVYTGVSDNSKVNKTGDDITGNLDCDNGMAICGFYSSLFSGNVFEVFSGLEPYLSTVLNRIEEKNIFAEVVNSSYLGQSINNFKWDIWEGENHTQFEFRTNTFDVYNNSIINLNNPVNDYDAANKLYVDTFGSGGTSNHSNLTNLAWELSGHTSDNSKVNKSGDNMTGMLNMTKIGGTVINMTLNATNRDVPVPLIFPEGDSFTNYYENATIRSILNVKGIQYWNLNDVGYIVYGTPTGNPGIVWLTKNYSSNGYPNNITYPYWRGEMFIHPTLGFVTQARRYDAVGAGSTANRTLLDIYGGFTIMNLSGSGNAFTRVDSVGKLYRDEIEGYTGSNQFLCINSTVGVYASALACG